MQVWVLLILIGYLCGSIPFGLLIGLARGVDIRQAGSGNVGATNTGRLLGRPWGITCFLLDAGKGFGPVMLAGLWTGLIDGEPRATSGPEVWGWLAVGAAAMLGHVFPVWLGFRGGKGVATGFGVLLGYWPVVTVAAAAAMLTWLLFAAVFRYVCVASVASVAAIPFYVHAVSGVIGQPREALTPFLMVTALMALLVAVRHRSNFIRLGYGTEGKIGERDP